MACTTTMSFVDCVAHHGGMQLISSPVGIERREGRGQLEVVRRVALAPRHRRPCADRVSAACGAPQQQSIVDDALDVAAPRRIPPGEGGREERFKVRLSSGPALLSHAIEAVPLEWQNVAPRDLQAIA